MDERDLVKSSSRVLDVFEFFHRVRSPSTEAEIRAALGLPKSSAHGLVRTLAKRGYLTYDAQKRHYFLSFRMVRLGAWLSSFYFGSNRLLEMMAELAAETGQVPALAMHNDDAMYLLALVDARDDGQRTFLEGQQMPIIGTAPGGAFLMTRTEAEVGAVLRRELATAPADYRELAAPQILAMVRKFRAQGYASAFGSLYDGRLAIGMPLPASFGIVPLYLAVGGSRQRVKAKEEWLARCAFAAIDRQLRAQAKDRRPGAALGRRAAPKPASKAAAPGRPRRRAGSSM